jgi:tRNA threonylcarbamoyladenosine biosynthesis protein TsaB
MNILAFDTTNSLASVCVMAEDKILGFKVTNESSNQAEMLFKLINESLEDSGLQMKDIDLVSVTNGPGSFTGVRVGLAAALGMQMHSKAKFIALSNFQVLAYSKQNTSKDIIVVLDARRGQVYTQSFNGANLEKINKPNIILFEELVLDGDLVVIGDGLTQEDKSLLINADARLLAAASEFYFDNNMYSNIMPLYIREPDIGVKKTTKD